MTKTHTIHIVARETVAQSWLRDMSTLAVALGLMLPGHFLDSAMIQWVGLGLLVFFVLHKSLQLVRENTFTIEQARARIDEIEATQ